MISLLLAVLSYWFVFLFLLFLFIIVSYFFIRMESRCSGRRRRLSDFMIYDFSNYGFMTYDFSKYDFIVYGSTTL